MSKEFKVTKERILDACGACEDARDVLEAMFPEAFEEKEEWVDITDEINWITKGYKAKDVFPHLLYGEDKNEVEVAYVDGEGFQICYGRESEYKVEQAGQTFRYLKKV